MAPATITAAFFGYLPSTRAAVIGVFRHDDRFRQLFAKQEHLVASCEHCPMGSGRR